VEITRYYKNYKRLKNIKIQNNPILTNQQNEKSSLLTMDILVNIFLLFFGIIRLPLVIINYAHDVELTITTSEGTSSHSFSEVYRVYWLNYTFYCAACLPPITFISSVKDFNLITFGGTSKNEVTFVTDR
jgi:hypothetical protein